MAEWVTCTGWGILWESANKLDGRTKALIGSTGVGRPLDLGGYITMVFRNRRHAREFINREYRYIRDRADLKTSWKVPRPVKVVVTVVMTEQGEGEHG